jgi:nucleosome assembly protein 1-like 1
MIKIRLNALRQLQLKSAQVEVNFYEELYLLECKYNKLLRPINEKRKQIINGEYEPAAMDDQINYKFELNSDLIASRIFSTAYENSSNCMKNKIKGIPLFWLDVMKRFVIINQMIEKYDEPILEYLYDIDVELSDKKPFKFELKFSFLPNEFFYETILTKTYEFKIEIGSNHPCIFEAPEIESSKGCKITWKKDKNVTGCKSASENAEQPSFFNYFSDLDIEAKQREDLTSDEETTIEIDYEIGYTFKEKIIPRAILYYLGEITDEIDDIYINTDEDDDSEDGEERSCSKSTKKKILELENSNNRE